MHVNLKSSVALGLLAMTALPVAGSSAQSQEPMAPNIVVEGQRLADPVPLAKGPEIKGIITARNAKRIRVNSADGASTIITITESTQIRTSGGLFGGRSKLGAAALLNGLPVTVKTMQSANGLIASQISFRSSDLKTATMIRNGTAQQFEEQAAATQALRGRMADIDQYNIKGTTNVYFDTGKADLSPQGRAELCRAASQAEGMGNALLLVVGYTDSVGSEEYNQLLSERRAGRVINYLQQACRWKPWRVLTPTGMAEADPLASNDTEEGKAQNRRVSVNILVSKAVDGF
jgi:OmpA-OmpF porin, OOP family